MNGRHGRARRSARAAVRSVLGGGRDGPVAPRPPVHEWRLRTLLTVVRGFYAEPVGWVALGVCTVLLTYGGGAVMFWFHAIYLGEGGPAISPWLHWLLDSTAGFLGLTPAIALILPVAAWLGTPSTDGAAGVPGDPTALARCALVGGGVLALVTAPAPLLHDALIGRGTPLADRITHLWGHGFEATGERQDVSAVVEMAQQVTVGVPTYVLLLGLGLFVVRGSIRLGRRAAAR
jgi:hypothetical protein